MSYLIGLQRLGIEPPTRGNYTVCPECRDNAKHGYNRKARKLWVSLETGNYECHNCGMKGRVDSDEWIQEHDGIEPGKAVPLKPQYVTPADAFDALTDQAVKYLESRGISREVAEESGVAFENNGIGPSLVFRYIEDGKLVKAKMRGISEKKFKQIPDCRPCAYGVDWIKTGEGVVITEGEIDALSFREAGIEQVISLDSGASNEGTETAGKFRCLDFARAYLDAKKVIWVAMDADGPGRYTALKLAAHLGINRCRIVEYPAGCKDANDTLIKHGPDELSNILRRARVLSVFDRPDLPASVRAALATRFDYTHPVQEKAAILTMNRDGRRYDLAALGMIGVISGHEKSGKSYVLSNIASAGIANNNRLGFELNLSGKGIAWFDTEQSSYFYHMTQRRILNQAGAWNNTRGYDAFHLRRFTVAERIQAIDEIIHGLPGLGCVVIDGVVDLVNDYNDLVEVQELVGKLMKWTDELNVLLLTVLHVNKGDGKIRGHIGSEMKNKCDFMLKVSASGSGDFSVSNPTGRYVTFPDFDFKREAQEETSIAEPEEMPF